MNPSGFQQMGGLPMGRPQQPPQPEMSQSQFQDRQNNHQIQRQVLHYLQNQKVPAGWQQSVQIQERAMKIYQLISSVRLIQPPIDIHHAIGVATGFEIRAFEQSPDKATYDRVCQEKLARIRDTRAKQAMAMQQAQNNQSMNPNPMQQMPMAGNMQQNMGGPQGHPGMAAAQGINPNFLRNMDHIQVQQQDGLRSQEAGQLVVPANSGMPQRMNAQFPNMLQQQGANRGPMMNPGLAAQQQQQWNNAQQAQREKIHLHAQAQAQARFNAQARATPQMGMANAGGAAGGMNPQQAAMSQSPAMPMLNRPMNAIPQPQGTPQSRPPSRVPQVPQDGVSQPTPQMLQQRMAQNGGRMGRPPLPEWIPHGLREQLSVMEDEQYCATLQKVIQSRNQMQAAHRQQAMAAQQAGEPQQAQQGQQPHQQQQQARQQPQPQPQQQSRPNAPNQQPPPFNPNLQRQMQPTPIPGSQPPRPQQQPGSGPRGPQEGLTEEENGQVNVMASEMAKNTPKAEMEKIRANLQNMAPEHKKSLQQRNLDPLAFFFRSQALTRFKKNKQEQLMRQAMAQNNGGDPSSGQMMVQSQSQMPQAPQMQPQGSQGVQQHPAQAQQMPGGQTGPGQTQQPNTKQQTPDAQNHGSQQGSQRPASLIKNPIDVGRNQANGPQMTNEQLAQMDKLPFPMGIINTQNGVSQLPKAVKTWGQLKAWAGSQRPDEGGVTVQKLLTIQRIHFMQTMVANRNAQAQHQQQGVPGVPQQPARGVPPGSAPQGPAQAAPMQPQRSQQGGQSQRVPYTLQEDWEPSPQEVQRARLTLPPHAQAWTDDMVRQFLIKARERKLQEYRQMQQNQQAQQGQQPNVSQSSAQPGMPSSATPQPRSQPQAQPQFPRSGPAQPNVPAQAPPKPGGRGATVQQPPPPQPPPGRGPLKRSSSNEVIEIANPITQPPRQPQVSAQPHGQPMLVGQGPFRPLPPEQLARMTPDQRAQYDAHVRRQALQSQVVPGFAPNDPRMIAINQKLRELIQEETQKMEQVQRPPVDVSPEQQQKMMERLAQAKQMLSRIDTALRVSLHIGGDMSAMRQIIQKRLLLQQQFRRPPPDRNGRSLSQFTMGIEEFDKTLAWLTRYFQHIMGIFQQQRSHPGQPHPARPTAAQPGHIPLSTSNLQQLEQQHLMQKARHSQGDQQKQSVNDSKAQPAPPSVTGPLGLSPQSPQGVPRKYGPTEVTQDKLKLPPQKKRKPNAQASTASTPAQPQATPDSASPQVSKPASPEVKKHVENQFKCTVPGCEGGKQGFATKPELAKHVAETHKPKEKVIEKPMEYALENIRKCLGLDENGKMKTPKPDAAKGPGESMKRESGKQGVNSKPAEAKSATAANKAAGRIGKAPSPASAPLKTAQGSGVTPKETGGNKSEGEKGDVEQRRSQEVHRQMNKAWQDSHVSPNELSEIFDFVSVSRDGLALEWDSDPWEEIQKPSVGDSSSSDSERSPPKTGSDSPRQPGSDVLKHVELQTLDLTGSQEQGKEAETDMMDVDGPAVQRDDNSANNNEGTAGSPWNLMFTDGYDPLDDSWYQDLMARSPPRGQKRKSEDREVVPDEMYRLEWDDLELEKHDSTVLPSCSWKEVFG